MKSFQVNGRGGIELKLVDPPRIVEPNELIVQTRACGFCNATDLNAIRGRRNPRYFGHEVTGVVVEVGAAVRQFQPGDPVILGFRSENDPNTGFSEFVLSTETLAYPLPDNVSFVAGVIGQLMCISGNAVRRAMKMGDNVAVFGQGPAGALITEIARVAGAAQITVIDLLEERLQFGLRKGADRALNPARDSVREQLSRHSDPIDVAFEASGSPQALADAIYGTRRGGKVCILGSQLDPVSLDLKPFEARGVSLETASIFGDLAEEMRFTKRNAHRYLRYGKVKPEAYITQVVSLEDLPRIVELMTTSPARVMKAVVDLTL